MFQHANAPCAPGIDGAPPCIGGVDRLFTGKKVPGRDDPYRH